MAERRDSRIERDGVVLAGTIWLPDGPPRGGLVMHPGSGPSNRSNDGYFTPLGRALIAAGYAVSSYDKRGVGESTGRWEDAPIETQAHDLIAAHAELSAVEELAGLPVGVFGHSQGGWVALDATSREAGIDFVILNSGPAVSPAAQERFAAEQVLLLGGADEVEVEQSLARYDLTIRLARARAPFSEIAPRRAELDPYAPSDEWGWHFWTSILDFQPRKALANIHVPILTLWGEDDRLVPVEDSIAVLRSMVPPTRLDVHVFPGADHRLQVGDPPQLAPGYVETVLTFLESHSQS